MAVSPGYLVKVAAVVLPLQNRSILDPGMIKRRPVLRYWTLGTIVQIVHAPAAGAGVSERMSASGS